VSTPDAPASIWGVAGLERDQTGRQSRLDALAEEQGHDEHDDEAQDLEVCQLAIA